MPKRSLVIQQSVVMAVTLALSVAASAHEPFYNNPVDLAVSTDGTFLAVACEGTSTLVLLDLPGGQARSEINLPHHASCLALGKEGRFAVVAGSDEDMLSSLDLGTGRVVKTVRTGYRPCAVALDATGKRCFTANALSGDVSIVDLARGVETKRLRAATRPHSLALSPDGALLAVANMLSAPHQPDSPPTCEITLIGSVNEIVQGRVTLDGANVLRGVAWMPDGDALLVGLVRPKNLSPLVAVSGGFTSTNGLGFVRFHGGEADVVQITLDTLGRGQADPAAVAILPQSTTAFVALAGANRVLAVDLPTLGQLATDTDSHLPERLDVASRFVIGEVPVGADPVALASAPDGGLLYVANRLDDSISVIDTRRKEAVRRLSLGTASPTSVIRGEQLFYNASRTFHAQFSCATCHPDSDHDGLAYDIAPDGLGRNYVDNKSLLGVAGTAPFKWSGISPDFHFQCGVRAAKFIQRSEGFTPAELDDLVAYLASLPLTRSRYRHDGGLTAAQAWGKRIFERSVDSTGKVIPEENRCTFCHPPPRYTNGRSFDVGTRASTDSTGLFDTPFLNSVANTPPYLHDGRALKLEEIWTKFNPDDRHGRVNDLSKEELNALIEYLKSL